MDGSVHQTTGSFPVSARLLIGLSLLSLAGGLFKALLLRLHWRDAVVSACVSALAGLVVGCVCLTVWGYDKPYLTCAVVGVTSWIGGAVILDRLAFVGWSLAQQKFSMLRPFLQPLAPEPPPAAPAADASAIIFHYDPNK